MISDFDGGAGGTSGTCAFTLGEENRGGGSSGAGRIKRVWRMWLASISLVCGLIVWQNGCVQPVTIWQNAICIMSALLLAS